MLVVAGSYTAMPPFTSPSRGFRAYWLQVPESRSNWKEVPGDPPLNHTAASPTMYMRFVFSAYASVLYEWPARGRPSGYAPLLSSPPVFELGLVRRDQESVLMENA